MADNYTLMSTMGDNYTVMSTMADNYPVMSNSGLHIVFNHGR